MSEKLICCCLEHARGLFEKPKKYLPEIERGKLRWN
jgi:hypothetical protein